MANVAVQRVQDVSTPAVPLLKEFEKRVNEVQRRAFELFQGRGRMPGHDFDDWMRAEHEVMGWPAAELAETDREYKLEMSLPGFDVKQVEVTATPDQIVVHANCTSEKKTEQERIVWTEFGSNDVYRRISLPQAINPDQVTATLNDGLLKIMAAKAGAVKVRPAGASA
jgi:HSP20 family protein